MGPTHTSNIWFSKAGFGALRSNSRDQAAPLSRRCGVQPLILLMACGWPTVIEKSPAPCSGVTPGSASYAIICGTVEGEPGIPTVQWLLIV